MIEKNATDQKPKKDILLGGVIKPKLLLRLAFKNLFFKRTRTILTVVGVVIGIGSIIFLISFGFGLQDLVSRQVIGSQSVQTIDVTSPQSKILKLNQDAIDRMQSIDGVSTVTKTYTLAGKVKMQSSETETVLYGADKKYVDLTNLNFLHGKSLDDTKQDQTIVNSSLIKVLGLKNESDALNEKISISFEADDENGEKQIITNEFTIVGIFDSQSRAESFINSSVLESNNISDADNVKVVIIDKDNIKEIRDVIQSFGFTTASPLDTLDQINQVFTLLRFLLVGFGGIGMVIAVLGMFNTLTISLLERTREIGLMIYLGARKQDIQRLFIVESLLLALFGGFFGVLGAVTLGSLCNILLNQYARGNGVQENIKVFIVSPQLVFITLGLSLLLGLIVVYFPARRSTQIDPIDAMSKE